MKFTRQYQSRSAGFRGHDFSVDTRSMTVPDACPTLEEIILSGTAQRVGTPIYDSSFEEGAIRWRVQNAPLDVVLSASEQGDDDAGEAKRKEKPSADKPKDNTGEAKPTPDEVQ